MGKPASFPFRETASEIVEFLAASYHDLVVTTDGSSGRARDIRASAAGCNLTAF
jgi:hypothetical protein